MGGYGAYVGGEAYLWESFALNNSGNGSGKMQIPTCKRIWEGNHFP